MTTSKIGYGIGLAHATTLGGSYTPFAELLSVKPPETSVDEVKVYRSDNTTATSEKIPGWVENGDADLEITYAAGGGAAINALVGVPLFYKVTYPPVGSQATGDTEIFAGFISKFGRETPLKDAMKAKISIAVNGAVTFAAGS